jgi:hypothetical protein
VPPDNALQKKPRWSRLIALLIAVAVSVAIFFVLDWFYTATILKASPKSGTTCGVPDPVRHHAFQPNCSTIDHWGKDRYQFSTNSLGFRDEKVRDVSLADARPRVLILGDSFTEGDCAWRDTYVGRIAAHFPQYDFLNGGVASYSPSNYLNVARMLLLKGVEFDEALVFIDISDTQDEASFYRDIDASGAVAGPVDWKPPIASWQSRLRLLISRHFLVTEYVCELFERFLVAHGYYHINWVVETISVFDSERSAWTYRKISVGYAPLGVEGGIAKETAKMNLLWQELAKRHIPISVVVYPWPAQIVHDTADSRQVRIWRDWCNGKCKRFISLFPAFFAAKDHCPKSEPGCWYLKYFIFGDSHYNAAGNALVAQAVVESLAATPPAKAASAATRPPPFSRGRFDDAQHLVP